MNYNKLILAGHMVRDPDLKHLESVTLCKFGIAVNRRRIKDGENREDVCFVDCDAFGKTAELIAEHFAKGSPIFVEGRLQQSHWKTQDGQKRSKLGMVVERFTFVGPKPETEDDAQPAATDAAPTGEEIPF